MNAGPVVDLDPYDVERICGQCGHPLEVGQMVRLSAQGIIHDHRPVGDTEGAQHE